MIYRVHGYTAHFGSPSKPARAPRLAQTYIFVINIANLADCCLAVQQNSPQLARWKFQQCITTFLGHELHPGPGAACKLAALSCLHLNIVDNSPQGDLF
jgi:hypothetical protein